MHTRKHLSKICLYRRIYYISSCAHCIADEGKVHFCFWDGVHEKIWIIQAQNSRWEIEIIFMKWVYFRNETTVRINTYSAKNRGYLFAIIKLDTSCNVIFNLNLGQNAKLHPLLHCNNTKTFYSDFYCEIAKREWFGLSFAFQMCCAVEI